MPDHIEPEFQRLPGLFRLWDLQFVLNHDGVYQVAYAELTEHGTPLFAVFRQSADGSEVVT